MRPNNLTKHAAIIFTAAFGLVIGANAMAATKDQQKMLDKASIEGFILERAVNACAS